MARGEVPAATRGPGGDWLLPAAAAAYAVSAAACCALAATGRAQFVDLHVYRLGADTLLRGGDLYGARFAGLPFTYPPFAAAALAALAAPPWAAAAALLAAATVVALPLSLRLALRLSPLRARLGPRAAWSMALALGAAAIWLEPARTTLGYGQIDVLLAAVVLYDLSLPDHARRKGAAIGLAAGVKLTPAIFLLYLLLTRRRRASATAAGTLLATVAAGFALAGAASARYWGGMFLNPAHVGPVQDAENQSLLGAMARTVHSAHVLGLWLPLAAAVGAAGLALAARAQRTGDEALGFSLCAVTGLLVSPISWTHHWALAVPALALAGVAVYRGRDGNRAGMALGAAAIAAAAAVGWSGLARHDPGRNLLHLPAGGVAATEIYVIFGLAALAVAAVRAPAKARPAGAREAAGAPAGPDVPAARAE